MRFGFADGFTAESIRSRPRRADMCFGFADGFTVKIIGNCFRRTEICALALRMDLRQGALEAASAGWICAAPVGD